MPKKSPQPLELISTRLYEGDKRTLASFYPNIGYNSVIREIIHRHCRLLLEREARQQQPNHEELPDAGTVIDLEGDRDPIAVNG